METKVLTQEEISSLKEIQSKRIQLTERFGVLEIQYEAQKQLLKNELTSLLAKEELVGNQLQQKYGNGSIDSFKKSGDQSYIEKYNSFLMSEIISDLAVYSDTFERMLKWKNVRNYIVHRAKKSADKLDLTFLNSITSENGKLISVGSPVCRVRI